MSTLSELPRRGWTLRVERRLTRPRWVQVAVPIFSIILALLAGALIIAFNHVSPWAAYKAMYEGAFGNGYGIAGTFVKMIPLLLAGLGVSIAFRMKLWNIGAEGQLYFGAFLSGGLALFLPNWLPGWPPWLLISIIVAGGMVGGAFWGIIPGFLKAKLEVNEIITTLMMNYIAIYWMDYVVTILWRDPHSLGFPLTPQFERSLWLPRTPGLFFLPANHRVHIGLLFGLVAMVLIWVIMRYSKWGYEIKVIGENSRAAKYAGMNIARNVVLVMALSGALAGLAGVSEILGIIHRLQHQISPGYGYTAIIIAWLAKLNPIAIVLVSFLFGGLLVAGDQIQITMHMPGAISSILQGLILFFVLGGEILSEYKVRFVRREEER